MEFRAGNFFARADAAIIKEKYDKGKANGQDKFHAATSSEFFLFITILDSGSF
jgi:hypothetical protein